MDKIEAYLDENRQSNQYDALDPGGMGSVSTDS